MPTYYAPGRRRGNTGWTVRGWIAGREVECRTPCTNKTGPGGAQEYWREFATQVRRDGLALQGRILNPSFTDAAAAYRQTRDLSREQGRYLARLEAEIGNRPLAELTTGVLQAAALRLYPAAKAKTRNRQAVSVAAAVIHAWEQAHDQPLRRIRLFKETEPERPIAYPESLEGLIARARKAGELELLAALLIFQRQGWRVSETLALERGRIDWRRGEVVRRVAKSHTWRRSLLDPAVLEALAALPERADGRLFRWRTRHGFYKAVDALAGPRRAGKWRPHMSRRGLATALSDEGEDLAAIMGLIGWQDPASARPYIRDDPKRARRSLAKIGARIGARGKRKAG